MHSWTAMDSELVATVGGHNTPCVINTDYSMAKKPRKRSPHPGVVLLKPTGRRLAWRARYEDPDEKRVVYESLDDLLYRDGTARSDWAKKKAKALRERKEELSGGAAPKRRVPIKDGFADFLANQPRLRESTMEGYKKRAELFQKWAEEQGATLLEHITGDLLLEYKDHLLKAKHERRDDGRLLSLFTVNRILRETTVPLRWLFFRKRLPSVSETEIAFAFQRAPAEPKVEYLSGDAPRRLLRAAIENDAAAHRKLVSPFILALLVSGMRFSECLELTWGQVDLAHGGLIKLEAEDTKTKKSRVVELDVTPSLASLLGAIPRKEGESKVFWWLTRPVLDTARRRFKAAGFEHFSWQMLRRTTGTWLTCAPGIYGGSSAYNSAQRLGHSVAVAERFYLKRERNISPEAKTLEQAMGIEAEADEVLALVRERLGGRHGA